MFARLHMTDCRISFCRGLRVDGPAAARPCSSSSLARETSRFAQRCCCWNQDGKIARIRSTNQALHRQQASHSFDDVVWVGVRFCVESRRAGGFLTKNKHVGWVGLVFSALRNQLWERSHSFHYGPLRLYPGLYRAKSLGFNSYLAMCSCWAVPIPKRDLPRPQPEDRTSFFRNALRAVSEPDVADMADKMPSAVSF